MTIGKTLPLLSLIALAAAGPALAGAFVLWQRKRRKARRRSPLTADLLRPAGYSLRLQIEEVRDKIDEVLLVLLAAPLFIYAAHITLYGVSASDARMGVSLAFGLLTLVFGAAYLARLTKRLDQLRLGSDAEMAIGQELDQLMRKGAVVFHDVPADKFNVDHLVIAPSGVFAVETKGRAKPIRGRGTDDASLRFDGKALHFPGWSEGAPLAQAVRQAKWVADWLTNAVGSPVETRPVLAVPGWWIDRTGKSEVLIFNGKNPQFLLSMTGQALSAEMIQRISYQVDQRCRTVKPVYARE